MSLGEDILKPGEQAVEKAEDHLGGIIVHALDEFFIRLRKTRISVSVTMDIGVREDEKSNG